MQSRSTVVIIINKGFNFLVDFFIMNDLNLMLVSKRQIWLFTTGGSRHDRTEWLPPPRM